MGCEKSKTAPIEDQKSFQKPGKGVENPDTIFSELQVDTIKSTWPLVAQDLQGNGIAVFLDIFSAEPAVKNLFPYKHMDGDKLTNHPLFRSHTLKFMQTFDLVCESLSDLKRDCPVSRRLMILGAQHATIQGFDVAHFGIFSKCLHLTWERVLGEEYTEDVKDAWSAIFEFVMDRIRDGKTLFEQEEKIPYTDNSEGVKVET